MSRPSTTRYLCSPLSVIRRENTIPTMMPNFLRTLQNPIWEWVYGWWSKDSMTFALTNGSGRVPVCFMRYMHRISLCISPPCHLDTGLASRLPPDQINLFYIHTTISIYHQPQTQDLVLSAIPPLQYHLYMHVRPAAAWRTRRKLFAVPKIWEVEQCLYDSFSYDITCGPSISLCISPTYCASWD